MHFFRCATTVSCLKVKAFQAQQLTKNYLAWTYDATTIGKNDFPALVRLYFNLSITFMYLWV